MWLLALTLQAVLTTVQALYPRAHDVAYPHLAQGFTAALELPPEGFAEGEHEVPRLPFREPEAVAARPSVFPLRTGLRTQQRAEGLSTGPRVESVAPHSTTGFVRWG